MSAAPKPGHVIDETSDVERRRDRGDVAAVRAAIEQRRIVVRIVR